jgi:hypothetical protein
VQSSTRIPLTPQRRPKIELAPVLFEALCELAAAEDVDLRLLVTLLIKSGLDHRGGRRC